MSLSFKDKASLKEWLLKTKDGQEVLGSLSTEHEYAWLFGTERGKKFLGSLGKYLLRFSRIPVLVTLEYVNGNVFASVFCRGPVSVKLVSVPVLENQTPQCEIALQKAVEAITPETHKKLLATRPETYDVSFKTVKEHVICQRKMENRRWTMDFLEEEVKPAWELSQFS